MPRQVPDPAGHRHAWPHSVLATMADSAAARRGGSPPAQSRGTAIGKVDREGVAYAGWWPLGGLVAIAGPVALAGLPGASSSPRETSSTTASTAAWATAPGRGQDCGVDEGDQSGPGGPAPRRGRPVGSMPHDMGARWGHAAWNRPAREDLGDGSRQPLWRAGTHHGRPDPRLMASTERVDRGLARDGRVKVKL
jgi:hypothetical protein